MSKNIYFTPGPSQLFYSFKDHFTQALKNDIPSLSHRSPQFVKVLEESTEAVKELLGIPKDYYVFYLNSANEAWDRIIQNLVVNQSHHFANGSFSKKFYDFAQLHGMNSTITQKEDGGSFDDLSVPEDAELVGLCKNETSVGYSFTESEIHQLREANKDKIIALDIVSASPAIPVNFQNIDTAYLSVQKAFGMPAGLGIWIANERCIEKAGRISESKSIGSYRALPNLQKFALKNQTPETPNMLYIYIMGEIAKDLIKYGVKRVHSDTIYKATLLRKTIDDHPQLSHFVESKAHRSNSTIVAKSSSQEELLKSLSSKGLILGKGYGSFKEEHIRIANFPTHSKEVIELLCDTISKTE